LMLPTGHLLLLLVLGIAGAGAVGINPCVRDEHGKCTNCFTGGLGCTAAGNNEHYRAAGFDTLFATQVSDGAVHVDGKLDELAWSNAPVSRTYTNVPFAKEDGEVVVFEEDEGTGGSWSGPEDFSTSLKLAWDSQFLYLAIDVTDDVFKVDGVCFKQGVQLAFEVGGAESQDASGAFLTGVLQAKRSRSTLQSRLDLLNVGFKPGQQSCLSDSQGQGAEDTQCCMDYEHDVYHTLRAVKVSVSTRRQPLLAAHTNAALRAAGGRHAGRGAEAHVLRGRGEQVRLAREGLPQGQGWGGGGGCRVGVGEG
jgi:hypothetical protein